MFLPYFHFDNPESKLTPEWCRKVIDYLYANNLNVNLLYGKKVEEIDSYASGNFSMTPYKMMFKSMKKKILEASKGNMTGGFNEQYAAAVNTVDLEFEPLPLIPIKLNSAIANTHKIPVDATCTASDALAMKKRKEDLEFLKYKPAIEADLQEIADELGVGDVDLGTTKHSTMPFENAPMGLDLTNAEHAEIFQKLFYSLRVETANEKALKQLHNVKNSDMIRRLVETDHFKYGVGAMWNYQSSMTGLPDLEYVYPGNVFLPPSRLPDYSDRTHWFIEKAITVQEMFNYFSDEIRDEKHLEEIINGEGKGYCKCNGRAGSILSQNWGTEKIRMIYFEVRTVDWIGIKEKKGRKMNSLSFTTDESEAKQRIWAQNTYGFWWLVNTDYFFGIHRLGHAYRTKGKEAFQNFSMIIYKSQEKSAVELSIKENKKAQIADLKMEHLLKASQPHGKYVDLRFLRGAIGGLKDEASPQTIDSLVQLFMEKNWMIGDTTDFEGKNDGQFKPFIDIPGGLKDEVRGYIQVIQLAKQNIADITGINENLTGQSAEELVGLQELRINSGLNAIAYCADAIKHQYEALNNSWASLIQRAIEQGGKTKEAVVNMIGKEDVALIDALDETPLHELTISINIGQRYFETQAFLQQFQLLKQQGIVRTVDEYVLSAIDNPKEKMQKLYFIEERWRKQQQDRETAQMANMQAIEERRGQNQLAVEQQKGQQKINEKYVEGDVNAKLMELGTRLGYSDRQIDFLQKRALQNERNKGQTEKGIQIQRAKQDLEAQQPLV